MDSEGDDSDVEVVEVDAGLQDESLKVCAVAAATWHSLWCPDYLSCLSLTHTLLFVRLCRWRTLA